MALYESSKLTGVSAYGSGTSTDAMQICSLRVPANGKYQIIFGGTTNKQGGGYIGLEYYGASDLETKYLNIVAATSSSDIDTMMFESYLQSDSYFPMMLFTQDYTSGKWFSGFISIVQIG